jgi:hypothetical protein
MQKNFWVTIHNVGKTTQFFGGLKHIKKNENIQFGQIYIYVIFWGDICFTYQFFEDQKLKRERSCEFLKKKKYFLSDLTPSYGNFLRMLIFLNVPIPNFKDIVQPKKRGV